MNRSALMGLIIAFGHAVAVTHGLADLLAQEAEAIGQRLIDQPLLPLSLAREQCLVLPRVDEIGSLYGGVIDSVACEVESVGALDTGSTDRWHWVRYRWEFVFVADHSIADVDATLFPDTIREDHLVLFSEGEGARPGMVRPAWEDRAETAYVFLRDPRIMRFGDQAVMAHRRCLNGTGGCLDHPFLLGPGSTVRPLVPAYQDQLRARISSEWGTWKGSWLDPSRNAAEAAVYLPGDGNADPSFFSLAFLRLAGHSLVADTIAVFPNPLSPTWRIDPEAERFGPVGRLTSESDLRNQVGETAIETAEVYMGEGICAPGSRLFPDRQYALDVAWADEMRTRPAFVQFTGDEGPWRTPLGIGPGTPVGEMAELQGAPVEFSGFGWDYGGSTGWSVEGGDLHIVLNPTDYNSMIEKVGADPLSDRLFGDRTVRSDDPLLSEVDIRVFQVSLRYVYPEETFECSE